MHLTHIINIYQQSFLTRPLVTHTHFFLFSTSLPYSLFKQRVRTTKGPSSQLVFSGYYEMYTLNGNRLIKFQQYPPTTCDRTTQPLTTQFSPCFSHFGFTFWYNAWTSPAAFNVQKCAICEDPACDDNGNQLTQYINMK